MAFRVMDGDVVVSENETPEQALEAAVEHIKRKHPPVYIEENGKTIGMITYMSMTYHDLKKNGS